MSESDLKFGDHLENQAESTPRETGTRTLPSDSESVRASVVGLLVARCNPEIPEEIQEKKKIDFGYFTQIMLDIRIDWTDTVTRSVSSTPEPNN